MDQQPHFVVVDKPPGMLVLGESTSLLQRLRADLALTELHPVHRLDRGTSGLVLFANGRDANSQLTSAFARREVEKYYLALIDNKPKKKQGLISGDMAKARNGSYKLLRSQINPARTAFFSYALGGGERVVLAKIYTGKTHQIRVAMRAMGAPIIGDERYGGTCATRMYLHALQLKFHFAGQAYDYIRPPTLGERFEQPLFRQKIAEIGSPAALPWPK